MTGYLCLICCFICCLFTLLVPVGQTAVNAEKVISLRDVQTLLVRRNDILVIRPPMEGREWQVACDSSALERLMSPDRLRRPPPEGWPQSHRAPRRNDICGHASFAWSKSSQVCSHRADRTLSGCQQSKTMCFVGRSRTVRVLMLSLAVACSLVPAASHLNIRHDEGDDDFQSERLAAERRQRPPIGSADFGKYSRSVVGRVRRCSR